MRRLGLRVRFATPVKTSLVRDFGGSFRTKPQDDIHAGLPAQIREQAHVHPSGHKIAPHA